MRIDTSVLRVGREELLTRPPRGGERYAELAGPAGGGTRSYLVQLDHAPEFIELIHELGDRVGTRTWALSRSCAHHDEYHLVHDSELSFPASAGFWGRVSAL